MQESNFSFFKELLIKIAAAYSKALSEDLIMVYWYTLEIFEMEDVRKAFFSHLKNPDVGQFFPKPADIIRFIEGSGETRALRAWTRVEASISRVGAYASPIFDDHYIHAVIEAMGGWKQICSVTYEGLPFMARDFQKRYMGYLIKAPLRYPKYLCGITNAENARQGYPLETPVYLGNYEKALEVMQGGGGVLLELKRDGQRIEHCIPAMYKTIPAVSKINYVSQN